MFIAVAAAVDAVVFAWSLKRELLIDSKTSHSKTKNVFYILVWVLRVVVYTWKTCAIVAAAVVNTHTHSLTHSVIIIEMFSIRIFFYIQFPYSRSKSGKNSRK